MNWASSVDIYTFNDAWHTWDNYFRKKYSRDTDFKKFYKSVLDCEYVKLTVNKIKKMKVDNISYARLDATNVEEAYEDRPRGDADLESIYYHLDTKECVSPIVIVYVKSKYILLDGMHRLVASHFKNKKSKVLCCLVILNN